MLARRTDLHRARLEVVFLVVAVVRGTMRTLFFATFFVALSTCAVPPATDTARPAQEVVSGGGRVRGNGIRMDVSIGGPLAATTAKNGAVLARPNKAVTP